MEKFLQSYVRRFADSHWVVRRLAGTVLFGVPGALGVHLTVYASDHMAGFSGFLVSLVAAPIGFPASLAAILNFIGMFDFIEEMAKSQIKDQ